MKKLAAVLMLVSSLAFGEHGGGGGDGSAYMKMEPLVVNLSDGHYLQVIPQLKPVDAKDQELIKAYMPFIRHEMIKSVIGKEVSKVQTPEFMDSCAKTTTNLINEVIKREYVKAIFFESWIVQ